jgi:D-threonine aldolase
VHDVSIPTPALVVDLDVLESNLATMAAALPGSRLRPHVKAHKCTSLARRQVAHGHLAFTCATIREVEGMARAGLGHDLLLANEVLHAHRLGAVADETGARVTIAVDSAETLHAAAMGGVREVLVDVNVGLPRCGCRPDDAGRIADLARDRGLDVRGVMGYEGHATAEPDADKRRAIVERSMEKLLHAHSLVGGEVISAGSTVTYAMNTWATEIQAGSYALMDTAFGAMEPAFQQALSLELTVISAGDRWSVGDGGLKALGMDHGPPSMDGADVLIVSDEHLTFVPHEGQKVAVGDRVHVRPAHVDPTVAYHEQLHVVQGGELVDVWPVDLRGW